MKFILLMAIALLTACQPAANTGAVANDSIIVQNRAAATPKPNDPDRTNTDRSDPPQADESSPTDALDIIREYYAAINAGDHRKAYELWSGKGEASKQTYEEFRGGFANTASVEVEMGGPGRTEGAAGSRFIEVPVRITAKTRDGQIQRFSGKYTLRRAVVDGATAEQRAWRIYSADIRKE